MSNIIIFHTSEGEAWADFLTNKLISPYYELPIRKCLFNTKNFEFSAECNVQVLLLTPEFLETATRFKIDFLGLKPERCVVVLLGVDRDDVRTCLSANEQFNHLFACKVSYVTSEHVTITKTIVTIIETYEELDPDDDAIYAIPPSPKQINQVFQVIPEHVIQGEDSLVYVLLDRKSESEVKIQCDLMDEGIVTDCLDKAVYSIQLPENAKGEVNLSIISDDQVIGEEIVTVESKLDRIRGLLEAVVDPVKLLCKALGLETYSTKSLDDALTHKLKSKCSSSLFQSLVSSDELNFTEDKVKTQWPTLLHFAAEYNLINFTKELLKHPGIIIAACSENIDQEYPSTLAESRGHHELEKVLVNFVLERKNGIDSGIIDPCTFNFPPPEPHLPKPIYVNSSKAALGSGMHSPDLSSDEDYVKMDTPRVVPGAVNRLRSESRLTVSQSPKERSHKAQLYASQRSASEGEPCRISFLNAHESPNSLHIPIPSIIKPKQPAPVLPNKIYRDSQDASFNEQNDEVEDEGDDDDAIYSVPPPASPLIQPRFKLDVLSETSSQRSSIISSDSSVSSKVESAESWRPTTVCISDVQFDDVDTSSKSNQFLSVHSVSKEDIRGDKPMRRNKTIQSKIASFVRKLKPKFTSTSDLPRIDKSNKKTKIYGRGSDPGFEGDQALSLKVQALANASHERSGSLPGGQILGETERDSGSYSEEEEDSIKPTKPAYNKKDTRKLKRNDKNGLLRKQSVRVTIALRKGTDDAPTVPIKTFPDI